MRCKDAHVWDDTAEKPIRIRCQLEQGHTGNHEHVFRKRPRISDVWRISWSVAGRWKDGFPIGPWKLVAIVDRYSDTPEIIQRRRWEQARELGILSFLSSRVQ